MGSISKYSEFGYNETMANLIDSLKELTASYFHETGNISASVELTEAEAIITCPRKAVIRVPKNNLYPLSFDAISNIMPDWKLLSGRWRLPYQPPDDIVSRGSSDDLQLFASLLHIVYCLYTTESMGTIYGTVLRDNLPPKNKLIIPSINLQTDMKTTDADSAQILFKLHRLFVCNLKLESSGNEQPVSFYYRPYHTPIVPASKLEIAGQLNSKLKDAYARMLN